MSSDLFSFTSSNDEDEVNSKLALFTEAFTTIIKASNQKNSQNPVDMDRYGAHDRLVTAYFSETPMYDEQTFRTRDCTGRVGISQLMKCTSAIRQLTYDIVLDALDEYLQMGAITARDALAAFHKAITELYGYEFLRKSTYTNIEKLYAFHEQKPKLPGLIGSIDCLDWLLENCPNAY
nr:hypothetical protein [Tanacetum cinerariifolium]